MKWMMAGFASIALAILALSIPAPMRRREFFGLVGGVEG
jgi:hypothetical protein